MSKSLTQFLLPASVEMNRVGTLAGQYLESRFPDSRGMVSLSNLKPGIIARQYHWGEQITCDIDLHKRNCRISNLAARDVSDVNKGPMLCPRTQYPHLCQPILLHQQLVGIIHIGLAEPVESEADEVRLRRTLQEVCDEIAGHLDRQDD